MDLSEQEEEQWQHYFMEGHNEANMFWPMERINAFATGYANASLNMERFAAGHYRHNTDYLAGVTAFKRNYSYLHKNARGGYIHSIF